MSPPRTSTTFAGVVESFDVKPVVAIGALRIEEGQGSCDRDGFIDAGEEGRIIVPIINGGPIDLLDTTVSISSPTGALPIKKASQRVASVAPFSTVEVVFDVDLDSSFTGIGQL